MRIVVLGGGYFFCAVIWKSNIKCLTLYSINNINLKTYFMGRRKKPMCLAFDLGEFAARVTDDRVDIETKTQVWKTVFYAGTVPYVTLCKLLVPEAFADVDPQCAEIAATPHHRTQAKEQVKTIALDMFAVAVNIFPDPLLHKDIWEALNKSMERSMKPAEEITKAEDDAILAEVKALHDPTEENIAAAADARKLADGPAPAKPKTKKKK